MNYAGFEVVLDPRFWQGFGGGLLVLPIMIVFVVLLLAYYSRKKD